VEITQLDHAGGRHTQTWGHSDHCDLKRHSCHNNRCNAGLAINHLGPASPLKNPYSKCNCGAKTLCCLHLGSSPVKIKILEKYLQRYENCTDSNIKANWFKHGFKMEYKRPSVAFECQILKSAYEHKNNCRKTLIENKHWVGLLGHLINLHMII
jgi:hypothetical protein